MKLTREEFAAMRRGAEHDLQMSAQMPSVLICAGTGHDTVKAGPDAGKKIL